MTHGLSQQEETAQSKEERESTGERLFGMKRDYFLSGLWEGLVLISLVAVFRYLRPISEYLGWQWAGDLPFGFHFVIATLVLGTAYYHIGRKYTILPLMFGLPYLLGRIIFLVCRVVSRSTGLTVRSIWRFIKAADNMIISWSFSIFGTVGTVAILLYSLFGELSNTAIAHVMMVFIGASLLFVIRRFIRWLVDPSRLYTGLWRKYRTSISHKGEKEPVLELDHDEILKSIGRLVNRVQTRSALGLAFTIVLLSVIGVSTVAFAGIYRCLHFIDPGALRGLTDMHWLSYLYFSVLTLFTVAFGDISPVTGIARLAVMLEILMGMFLFILAISSFSFVGVTNFDQGMERIAAELEDMSERQTKKKTSSVSS